MSTFTTRDVAFYVATTVYVIAKCVSKDYNTFTILVMNTIIYFTISIGNLAPAMKVYKVFCDALFLIARTFANNIIHVADVYAFSASKSPKTREVFIVTTIIYKTFGAYRGDILLVVVVLPRAIDLPRYTSYLVIDATMELSEFQYYVMYPRRRGFVLGGWVRGGVGGD